MATLFTETAHNAAFILSEANGQRSRANGTLAAGQNLVAGTVLMASGDNLVALTAAGTAGTLDGDAVGILINSTDATDAAVAVSYLIRDAEVNGKCLNYPETNGTDDSNATAANIDLLALGIVVRD